MIEAVKNHTHTHDSMKKMAPTTTFVSGTTTRVRANFMLNMRSAAFLHIFHLGGLLLLTMTTGQSPYSTTGGAGVVHALDRHFCWVGGVSKQDCCDVERFGPTGNSACWQEDFSFTRCCDPEMQRLEDTWGPKLLRNLESTPYEELESSLRQSLTQVENRTMSAQGSAVFLILLLRLRQRFAEAEQIPLPSSLDIAEDTGAWRGADAVGFHMHDTLLSDAIWELVKGKYNAGSVFDFGCGVGYYVRDLRKRSHAAVARQQYNHLQQATPTPSSTTGAPPGSLSPFVPLQAGGVDGNPDTVELSQGRCAVADLSKRLELGFAYDAVLSLEVAEHIPYEFEAVFVENLVRHASHLLILSWGDQPGHGHFNNKGTEEVVALFEDKGFALDETDTQFLREQASFPWFKQTLHVFRRRGLYR
ncbi:unnamed protein product [Amoebophrya sp. A25]|nr:unnamed protein product [Amoebophrya sp. A25]|eukprot:GSA25T00014767001.1